MTKKTILKLIVLALMGLALIYIMIKVEHHGIINEKEIEVIEADIIKEQFKLDSILIIKEYELKELERIRQEREFLQKLPDKSKIKIK